MDVVVVGYMDVGSHKYCVLRLGAGLMSRLTMYTSLLLRILRAVVIAYVGRVVPVVVVGEHAVVLAHVVHYMVEPAVRRATA